MLRRQWQYGFSPNANKGTYRDASCRGCEDRCPIGWSLAPVGKTLVPIPTSAAPVANGRLYIARSSGNRDNRAREEKRGAVLDSLRPVAHAVCYRVLSFV